MSDSQDKNNVVSNVDFKNSRTHKLSKLKEKLSSGSISELNYHEQAYEYLTSEEQSKQELGRKLLEEFYNAGGQDPVALFNYARCLFYAVGASAEEQKQDLRLCAKILSGLLLRPDVSVGILQDCMETLADISLLSNTQESAIVGISLYEAAAESGSIPCAYKAGMFYEAEGSPLQDYAKAAQHYKSICSVFPDAAARLGRLHLCESFPDSSFETGLRLIAEAAKAGSALGKEMNNTIGIFDK